MYFKVRMPFYIQVLISLSLCSLTIRGNEEILDTSYPILISENRDASPVSKTYFGYRVSLAKGKMGAGKSSKDPDGWIFITAPKANATSSLMYSNPSPLEPGLLWRCTLGLSKTSANDGCEVINVDPTPDRGKKRSGGPAFENHNTAWVGSTLEIEHDRLITCGMRWNRGPSHARFFNGICYWFPNTTQNSFTASDLSNLVNKNTYEQRLAPFFSADDTVFKLPTNDSGYEWQNSQAGISTHLYLDEKAQANLIIGAPGVREWAGAIVLYTNTRTPKTGMARANRNKADPIFSEFVVANRGIIPERGINIDRKHWGDYFGYAVSSGRYLDRDTIHYAAGAPRALNNGEVVIFSIPPYKSPSSTYKRQIDPKIEISPPSNSFGSYFGCVLHTVDLDGDKLDELIVGAPMFSVKSKVARSQSLKPEELTKEKRSIIQQDVTGDEGCVYIYRFTNEGGSPKSILNQTLFGKKVTKARFGSAISSIAFNLKNGSREIHLVIGSPYETSDDDTQSSGSGAVYLYKYYAINGRFGEYSQRIPASRISSSINGFGSSLNIPQDIDINNTPDMVIGAYKSGHAVVLRTRPRILIKSWIEFVSFEGQEIKQIRRGSPQFYVRSCFTITENLGLLDHTVDVWVRVKFTDRSIRFHDEVISAQPGNKEHEVSYVRTVNAHASKSCENLTIIATHKDGIGMDDSEFLTEIKNPFHFVQDVWYNGTLDRAQEIYHIYASDSKRDARANTIDLEAFDGRKPSSQTTKAIADISVTPSDCKDVCKPNISMSWTFYEHNHNISCYSLSSTGVIQLEIVILNTGETAAKPTLTLDWSNVEIVESVYGSRWLSAFCTDHSDTKLRTYGCPLGSIKTGRNKTINIYLDMKHFYVKKPSNYDFEINGRVGYEDDPHIKDYRGKGVLPLNVPITIVSIMGSRENDSLRNPTKHQVDATLDSKGYEEILYHSFRQIFTVEVTGASVQNVVSTFKIPVLHNGKSVFLIPKPQLTNKNSQSITCEVTAPSNLKFVKIESPKEGSVASPIVGGISTTPEPKLFVPAQESPTRRRRDIDPSNTTQSANSCQQIAIYMNPPRRPEKKDKMVVNTKDALTLSCDSTESCMEVTCTAKNVQAHSHLHIVFELFPVQKQIDELMKSSGKSQIFVETKSTASIFNREEKHYEDADVAQTMLAQLAKKDVELWVYFAAGGAGLLVLIIIVGTLYKCGFFKREKRQQLNHMKAEHNRKSMIAAARASMMIQSTSVVNGEGFESRENLTEAEHMNEDNEPKKGHLGVEDGK